MKQALRVLKWLVIALFLYVIGSIAMSIIGPMQMTDRVKIGMLKVEAIQVVGQEPMQEKQDFPPCAGPSRHWTGNCDALLSSGSKVLLIWKFGVDTILVVGLDAGGKVVFKGIGDT